MAEYEAAEKLGVSAIFGIGKMTLETKVGDVVISEDELNVYEIGGQAAYYVVGDFNHGMQVGAEAMYVKLSGDISDGTDISAKGAGFGIGPFIGYKIATDAGFTFTGQVGYQKLFAQAEASDDKGNNSTEEETTGVPLLNLNVGWSF